MLPPEFFGLERQQQPAFGRHGFAPYKKVTSSNPKSAKSLFGDRYRDRNRYGEEDNSGKTFAGTTSKTSFAAMLDALDRGEEDLLSNLNLATDYDEEEYEKVKIMLDEAKAKEMEAKNSAKLPMEDEPGSFAMMLEMTLDFFFLTPVRLKEGMNAN